MTNRPSIGCAAGLGDLPLHLHRTMRQSDRLSNDDLIFLEELLFEELLARIVRAWR